MSIGHGQFTGTGNRHNIAVFLGHCLDIMQTDSTAGLNFNTAYRCGTRGRTTNVEGTHGQLGTGLTDRLGGNNADRFTHIDLVPASQITTITGGTDTKAGFTGYG